MLQRIRDNSNGPMAYVIVGLITLVFGVWGIGSYFTGAADPVVASVGKSEITRYQLQQAYNQQYQQIRQQQGDNFDPDRLNPSALRQNILQGMIEQAVLDNYAFKSGYRVTDQAVIESLKQTPIFQANGQFSADRYRLILANAGLSPEIFEAQVRRDMLGGQVVQAIQNGAFVTQATLDRAYALMHEQRDVAYLQFSVSQYENQVDVSDDELAAWYDKHQSEFTQPAKVKLAYVLLDEQAIDQAAEQQQDQLQDLYEQNKAEFTTPETRDFKQLYISASDTKAAQATANKITAALDDGQSLDQIDVTGARLITRHAINRGDLPNSVASVLFGLEQGETSGLIKTDKGWYIVEPTKISPRATQAFDEPAVQNKLKAELKTQLYRELSKKMEQLAYQAPNDLDVLAEELNLPIQTTGWITQEVGEGIADSDKVRAAAFSEDVLEDGFNSEKIDIDDNRQVVVRIAEQQKAQSQPLAEVKSQVKQRVAQDKAHELAKQAAEQAQAQINDGKALAEVAQAQQVSLKKLGFIGRDATDDKTPPMVVAAAFAAAYPVDGKPATQLTPVQDAVAIVVVNQVKTPKVSDKTLDPTFVYSQQQYNARIESEAFRNYLEDQAKIKRFEDKIEPDDERR